MSRFSFKALFVALVAFALSTVASAQSTGTLTSFDNQYFSATFLNGPITADAPSRNNENTSTDYTYWSETPAIWESVVVRIIDHDIPVGFTATDFYADAQASRATSDGGTVVNRSTTWYQGHPVTYINTSFVENGLTYWVRARYIVINAREAIFIKMISLQADSNQQEWERFESSLTIK